MRSNFMKTKNIGGSTLPSSDPSILKPIPLATLQVVPDEKRDTHDLVLTRGGNSIMLASHPNGYSCHWLALHIVNGDAVKISEYACYIIACGGSANIAEISKLTA